MTELVRENMDKNRISVIIPVFKVEKYLERCVDSVLNQTYSNLEVILIDDGSPDGCPAICDRYAVQDKRVTVLHQENAGLAAVRNAGLKMASGEIISFVDSDDYIHKDMYADMMHQLLKNDADLVMCDFKYVYDNDDLEDKWEIEGDIDFYTGVEAQYMPYKSNNYGILFTVSWNKLYKKYLFDGISYPDNRIHEDEARTFQILYKVKKLVHIKRAYYYYFQNKNSIVGKKISKVNIQQLDAYCDKLCFYREYKENQLWQIAARHAMHMYCYMQKRFDDNNLGVSVRKERQGMYLEYELESSKEIEKVAFSLKLEIFFFLNLAGLYYKIWKMKKKVICRDE